jgi:hypothetical protein
MTLLEALLCTIKEKYVRLRVVMILASTQKGVKACLDWSLRWWWSQLKGSLVFLQVSMVMVKSGEGY